MANATFKTEVTEVVLRLTPTEARFVLYLCDSCAIKGTTQGEGNAVVMAYDISACLTRDNHVYHDCETDEDMPEETLRFGAGSMRHFTEVNSNEQA